MSIERLDFDPSPSLGFYQTFSHDIGVIVEAEKVKDESYKEKKGYEPDLEAYTGLYTVRLISRVDVLYRVIPLWQSIGSGSQSGTIFSPGTLVLIVYVTSRKIPIILGSFHPSYLKLTGRGDINLKQINPEERITELIEGEQIIQAAVKDEVIDKDKKEKLIRYKGGFIKVDKTGGVELMTRQDGDLLISHGDRDKGDSKITWIKIKGDRDKNSTIEIFHPAGTDIRIEEDGSITIENVKKKTEHTVDDHVQNDDKDLMITVKGKTILKCEDVQLGDEGGEKTLMGETFAKRFNDLVRTFNIHTHISGQPGSPTGPTSSQGIQSTNTDLSDKVHSKK